MSEVTLDELRVKLGVTPALLDKTCTDEHLRDVALFLESWRIVAPHLGLSSFDIATIERNVHTEEERRQKFLETWRSKFAFKAKYRILVEALLKVGRADQAQQVCSLLVPQQPDDGVSRV